MKFIIQNLWLHLLSISIKNCGRMFNGLCSDLSIYFNSIILHAIDNIESEWSFGFLMAFTADGASWTSYSTNAR